MRSWVLCTSLVLLLDLLLQLSERLLFSLLEETVLLLELLLPFQLCLLLLLLLLLIKGLPSFLLLLQGEPGYPQCMAWSTGEHRLLCL